MKKNDIKNIDIFIKNNNLDIYKVKVIYVIKNKENIDIERFLEYIYKYKFVDILYTNKVDSSIKRQVNNLNNEYGTSIEVIDKKNVSKYDIYILEDVYKKDLEGYILNKKRLVIELNNSTDDLFNEYNKCYDKNSIKLKNINELEKYNKTSIGYAIYMEKRHLTNSV
jgi:hypothetical protein